MASFNDLSEASFGELIANPMKFVKLCWPTMKLYTKQRDILISIRDNSKTFVHAANQMGKTRIAAIAALQFYVSRSPARVIATSASESQLKAILWNEMLTLVNDSRIKFPFDPKELLFRKIKDDGTTATDEYCIGYVTRSIESFQGHHLDATKPRILAVFEEACHDDQTEVLTDEGWRFFSELHGFELFYTLDPLTGQTSFRRATLIQRLPYKGTMYKYVNFDADFCVTPNHKMLYHANSERSGVWTDYRLDEIQNIRAPEWYSPRIIRSDDYVGPKDNVRIVNDVIHKVDYNGIVYCATVPPNHTLFTRRNGHTMWSGNSGIADEFYKASESWAHRTLVIGNPLSTTNFFYNNCKAGDLPDPSGHSKFLRKVIHIDGLDSPNVQIAMEYKRRGDTRHPPTLIPGVLSYHEYVQREASWKDSQLDTQTRLHGHFYEGEKALLFPMDWIDLAMATKAEPPATSIGVDVAMGGRDLTVWIVASRTGVLEMIAMDTPNTMEIPGRTIQLMRKWNVPAKNVAMDAGGGGKQIADRMREVGHHITIVAFGENAGTGEPDVKVAADYRKSYKNRRAELYGALRKVLDPAAAIKFALPRDNLLRQELFAMPLLYESDGRMVLPPKERGKGQGIMNKSLREIIGRSPDRADALALAAWMVFTRAGPLSWAPTEKTWENLSSKQERLDRMINERVSKMAAKLA